jgi:hypothetical protein
MCERCMSQTVWISIGLIGLLLVLAAGPLARQLAWLRTCWQARGATPRPLAAEPGKGGEAKGSARGTRRKAPEGPPPPPAQLTTPDVVYALAMLVGILGHEVWQTATGGAIGIRWPRVVGALVVAPVVYAGVYGKLAHDGRPTLLGLAVAFQNGFFWETVFQPLQSHLGE